MLRIFSKRLYSEKLFNQIPNVCKNIENNLSHICCNRNDPPFLNGSKTVHEVPVKVNPNFPNFHVAKRFKQKKEKAQNKKQDLEDEDEDDDDSDDEWVDEDESLNKDSRVMKFDATTTRLDFIAKKGFGISRNKIENYFYESKIRINGQKVLKKSVLLNIEDKVDLIKGNDALNPENLNVSRMEILDMTRKVDSIRVTVRRFKNLVIEDYSEPWKQNTSELS